jgi:hypothetical protein
VISKDERLRAIAILALPAFVGHFIQLGTEDMPWEPWAWPRYYTTPGWHLYLSPWVVVAIAVLLALSVFAVFAIEARAWLAPRARASTLARPAALAMIALYAAHYLTYPYRIRNHMTTMLSELAMLGGIWLVGWWSGAADLCGRGPRARLVDRYALFGMAAVLCVIYLFAALHKTNDNFLALDERSDAVRGLTTFLVYGDLGSVPPTWMKRLATWGTVVIEAVAPVVAWRVPRLRFLAITALFLFHFPHVAVMNVADYPMIASAFYVALFSRAHFRILLRHARPNAFTLAGGALGAAGQLWFMPWVGALTVFGIFVMALWGWTMGAFVRAWAKRRPSRATRS